MSLGRSRYLRICCLHSKKYAAEGCLSTPCVFYGMDVDDRATKDLNMQPCVSWLRILIMDDSWAWAP